MLSFVQLNDNLIHALELDVPHVIPLTSSGHDTMTVTLIDARHCPGSVMFLFDGYFGRILYTGYFRYEEGMLDKGSSSVLKSNAVDVLYIDNTFCSPKCVLPSRQKAKRQIIRIIEQHPRERVVFGLRGLGKEDILISLAKWFDVKITVSEERYRLLEVLALHEQFVMDCVGSEQTRFQAVELVEITRSSIDTWSQRAPTIAILLTGLFVGLGYQPFTASSDTFVVPLSDHSPYTELHEFTARLRPKSVVPIVRTDPGCRDDPLAASLLDRTNVECFAEHLNQGPMQNYHIPPSVLEMMNHTGNVRSRIRKQSSSCRRSVFAFCSPVSRSDQKLSRNLSALEEVASMSSVRSDRVVTASDINSVQWKSINTSSTVTSEIARKPRVAVRPMKRYLPSDQFLQSRFIKRRNHHWVRLPASFELRQKRYSTNEMLRQQRKQFPVSTCMANSRVPSTATQHNLLPSADVFSLKQSYDRPTCEMHPGVSVVAASNAAFDLASTVNHASRSGDSPAASLWQSSGNPVPTIIQITKPQINTGGTMINSVAFGQESSEYVKDTNAYAYVLPSAMALDHSSDHAKTLAYENGALNLTTSGTITAQPAFLRVTDSCSLLPSTGKHLDDSIQQHHDENITSSVFEDTPLQALSDSGEQLHLVSGTADAVQLLVDATVACNASVPCEILLSNQKQHVVEAKHGTAEKIDAYTPLVVNDQMYRPPVESASLNMSQYHDESSCNITWPVNALSINSSEEMFARERYPSIQLKVDVTLDNRCETALCAGNKSTANTAVMLHIGLPDAVDASSDHTSQVLPVSRTERETEIQRVPRINAVPKSTFLPINKVNYVMSGLLHPPQWSLFLQRRNGENNSGRHNCFVHIRKIGSCVYRNGRN